MSDRAESSSLISSKWKKYQNYDVNVDARQDDRSTEIQMLSLQRPHMRAFHVCWISFFIAFFVWFGLTPLLPEIRETLGLSKKEIWTSSIAGVGGTIFVRLLLGPLCDMYGARTLFAMVLCLAAVPTALTGLVTSANELAILRFCIGIAGGSFVMCQYWMGIMFSKEVVGSANGIVAGWGNLGASVTFLVMGSAFFPGFKSIFNGDSEMAWRTVNVVPAVVAVVTGAVIYFYTDDCPKGNYSELKRHGAMTTVSGWKSFCDGCKDVNTWVLFIQYACCFGVELTMNNATALYFQSEFGQSTETAAAIASIFGWMNLFARGLGGFISDWASASWGMRGRIWVQTFLLIGEGVMVLVFVNSKTLSGAILYLNIFSLFVQAAEGSSFGIVPYVKEKYNGSVCGIVGAGGNVGAVAFGLCFRQLEDEHWAFIVMAIMILASASLSVFLRIPDQSTIFDNAPHREKIRMARKVEVAQKAHFDKRAHVDVDFCDEFFV